MFTGIIGVGTTIIMVIIGAGIHGMDRVGVGITWHIIHGTADIMVGMAVIMEILTMVMGTEITTPIHTTEEM